jgi:aspartate carbamoyltransferase regulatory subunit
MDTTLKISKRKDGTVIDHVPGGMAFKVLSILRVDDLHENSVSIGIRVPSGKMGQKDVIKVENRYLERVEVDKISFVAPEATISIVKNYNITEKYRVELPEKVIGFIRCINPNCISNAREPVSSEFKLVSRAPISIRCEYCERSMSEREILQNL